MRDAYAKLPLVFVENAGQLDPSVAYSAQGGGYTFAFGDSGAAFAFADGMLRATVELGFVGASAPPHAERLDPGKVNYFIGNDPSLWRTDLSTYEQLRYRELWPGIDLVFHGERSELKYELRVAPGANVADIRLAYSGGASLSQAPNGDLVITTALGTLTDERPASYQETDGGRRQSVESRFSLAADGTFGFTVGGYDPTRPLVIDPGLVYSTFLGGSGTDSGTGIAVDAAGNAYVAGWTTSNPFPTTAGAYDTTANGNQDVFVTKLNPTGTGLVYSTYIGGGLDDQGLAIALDASGAAYITGSTRSTNFPTFALAPALGPSDSSYNGNLDAFIAKLNAAGGLVYSTYLGGSNDDAGTGIAIDSSGHAYVTGYTESTQATFPFTPAALDNTQNGSLDAFLTVVGPFGEGFAYSSFLGGAGEDRGQAIAIDATGDAFLTGFTFSTNFPTTVGAFDTSFNGGLGDAFVTRFNFVGSGLSGYVFVMTYSTFLGGGGDDRGFGIALDATGDAYVTGRTQGLPTTVGAYDTSQNGSFDAFVTKLNPTGTAPLVYSTYVGGSGNDQGAGIAVDTAGNAYLTGRTGSTNFPTTPGAFDRTYRGNDDAFVSRLSAAGAALVYSTYLGGSSTDRGQAIALDATANGYATGFANSANFPTTTGAFDTTQNGDSDAFVAKLDFIAGPTTLTLEPAADTNPVGTPHTVTATARNAALQPVAGVTIRFTVTGANPRTGSGVTDANGQATFTYTGTVAGTDAISAYADSNNNNTRDGEEPIAAAAKIWTPGPPATLVLTPATDTNEVGNPHTVTATVRDAFGNPVPNVTVRFTVTGANPTSGSSSTNASGQATFTYTGTHSGTDTITAYADSNGNNTQDAGEPGGIATKEWTPGPPASLTLAPPSATNSVGDPHTVTATVTDQYGNPVPGITVRFSVSGANTASGADVTDANGHASFTYTSTVVGNDTITAFADTNNNGTQDAGEPGGTATKHWRAGPPASMTLLPTTATNTVGERHCVTATVYDRFGNPVPDVIVRFSVPTHVATHAHPFSGSVTTDSNGEAVFCFTASLPGTDAIHAFADTNGNGNEDATEPFADATKIWTLPLSTAFCEVTITEGGWITTMNGDRASFGGNARVSDDGSSVDGEEEYQDHGPADPRNVKSIELLATTCTTDADPQTATIFGRATIDGSGDFIFRIDLSDGGHGGSNDSYGILMDDGYDSGQQPLGGGNVTIHKS